MTLQSHATAPLLRMRSISKRFPGVVALDDVDHAAGRYRKIPGHGQV